jgi:8-oxo-dGTP pyrophosphatase MutT (NUDIX family)
MLLRKRVVVYVEREDGLLVFDHRDHPEAGTQVPAGGVEQDEALVEAAIREVREETGVQLDTEPTLLGTHEHLDGLGQPALSHFFQADAPKGLPRCWQHVVSGDGDDAALVFECRFDPAPELWPFQSVFRAVGGKPGRGLCG